MVIYLGADHRGFELKNILKEYLSSQQYGEVIDVSETLEEGDDYPDHAAKVAEKVAEAPGSVMGILVCGSGAGVDIVANKFLGVRSVLALSLEQVANARRDDNVNVLSFSSDTTNSEEVKRIADSFLKTMFSGEERHVRRLEKITAIEQKMRS